MGDVTGPGPFDPSPTSSTGPFAPPDGSELEPDEFLQWVLTVRDIHTMATGRLLMELSSRKGGTPKNQDVLTILQNDIDSALGRLTESGPTLSEMADRIGEKGFEQALERADVQDKAALARVRERAAKVGGLVPFLQSQLADAQGAFAAERARMQDNFNLIRNGNAKLEKPQPSASPALCALGAGEMAAGGAEVLLGLYTATTAAATAVTGIGVPVAAVKATVAAVEVGAGAALLSSGTTLVSAQC